MLPHIHVHNTRAFVDGDAQLYQHTVALTKKRGTLVMNCNVTKQIISGDYNKLNKQSFDHVDYIVGALNMTGTQWTCFCADRTTGEFVHVDSLGSIMSNESNEVAIHWPLFARRHLISPRASAEIQQWKYVRAQKHPKQRGGKTPDTNNCGVYASMFMARLANSGSRAKLDDLDHNGSALLALRATMAKHLKVTGCLQIATE